MDYNLKFFKRSRCCCDRYEKDGKGEEGGFLLGASGIYMTAALIYHEFNEDESAVKYLEKCKKLAERAASTTNFLRHGSDEIFVGRAGYLCAIRNLHSKLNPGIFKDSVIENLIKMIVESGRQY